MKTKDLLGPATLPLFSSVPIRKRARVSVQRNDKKSYVQLLFADFLQRVRFTALSDDDKVRWNAGPGSSRW